LKVLITTVPFAQKDQRPLDMLKKVGAEIINNPLGRKLRESDLLEIIPGVDILIAGTEPITETVLSNATNLKLISRVGIGLDSIDLAASKRCGVEVCYTPDAPSPAVAELTIGLMIDLLRSVFVSSYGMHQGEWCRYMGRRLSDVTIGIIGAGRIGGRVIKHLAGFDCKRILVCDTDPMVRVASHPTCRVERVQKEVIYREADIISIHVPLTNDTRNLITNEEMSQMRSGTFLINTARGGIINELDLFNALSSGHLGGAAIDVFEEEPYSGNLASIDQCILTGHIGSMSADCRAQMEIEATEEAIRFILSEPLKSPVPGKEYDNQSLEC